MIHHPKYKYMLWFNFSFSLLQQITLLLSDQGAKVIAQFNTDSDTPESELGFQKSSLHKSINVFRLFLRQY